MMYPDHVSSLDGTMIQLTSSRSSYGSITFLVFFLGILHVSFVCPSVYLSRLPAISCRSELNVIFRSPMLIGQDPTFILSIPSSFLLSSIEIDVPGHRATSLGSAPLPSPPPLPWFSICKEWCWAKMKEKHVFPCIWGGCPRTDYCVAGLPQRLGIFINNETVKS